MANPILAAILSFFIPGLGQFYAGNLTKGIIMFVGIIVILLVLPMIFKHWIRIIINLLYSLYVAYDAYQMASYN